MIKITPFQLQDHPSACLVSPVPSNRNPQALFLKYLYLPLLKINFIKAYFSHHVIQPFRLYSSVSKINPQCYANITIKQSLNILITLIRSLMSINYLISQPQARTNSFCTLDRVFSSGDFLEIEPCENYPPVSGLLSPAECFRGFTMPQKCQQFISTQLNIITTRSTSQQIAE